MAAPKKKAAPAKPVKRNKKDAADSSKVEVLLPTFEPNKRFLKKEKFAQKRKEAEAVREAPPRLREKMLAKKAAAKKTGTEKTKAKTAVKATRRPKTTVGGAKTGKETLVKKKARELVRRNKTQLEEEEKKEKKTKKSSAGVSTSSNADKAEDHAPIVKSPKEVERELLQSAIRGNPTEDDNKNILPYLQASSSGLYPEVAFVEAYTEQKASEAVSQDALLQHADQFFRDLGRREQQLNRSAVNHLRELKAINRRGGDKDGFRYVVPKNAKQVVRQMMIAQGDASAAMVDPDALVSTFGGGTHGEEHDLSDKPMRRRRHRSTTFSNFYQFQVSREWTRNAENFLRRGRGTKSLFEAKKQQRSIKKL